MTHDVKDIDPSNPFMTKSNNMQNSSNGDNGQSSTVPIPISSSSPDSNSQYQRQQAYNNSVRYDGSQNQNFLIQHNESPNQGKGGMDSSDANEENNYDDD